MTAVFYINCRLVSDLIEIKRARRFQKKTLFEPFMQKPERGLTTVSPLSNICVVTETSHQKAKIPSETNAHAGQKTCLVVSCKHGFHAHAQGLLRPALTAAKMALASSLL